MEGYLVKGPISPEQVSADIAEIGNIQSAGGISIFLGQVRDDITNGKKVSGIEYSAYEQMVSGVIGAIEKDIFTRFSDVLLLKIRHSTGLVSAGEISLEVIVAAGHRDQATTACREAVELIKEKLPVWKKEYLDDSTYTWKEN